MVLSIGITGEKSYGTFQLRGQPLIDIFDAYYTPPEKTIPKTDITFLVKRRVAVRPNYPSNIRKDSNRLIFDPLDYWNTKEKAEPLAFWKAANRQLMPDDVLATSPSAKELFAKAFPQARIWLVPHHSDPRIESNWYDPNGPIVYCGDPAFIKHRRGTILEAASMLGKKFLRDSGAECFRLLQGASLNLALRLYSNSSRLSKLCKPQIKVANANAAGVPTLLTGDPCETSLYPDFVTLTERATQCPKKYVADMLRAMQTPRELLLSYTQEDYLIDIQRILHHA